MKKIPLSQGKYALVDDEDFESLSRYSWHVSWQSERHFKVTRSEMVDGRIRKFSMHREIMRAPCGKEVDHINHNTLDNRKENLRICTRAENMWNSRIPSTNTSGLKGVSWSKQRNKWLVHLRVRGETRHLGYFSTKKAARQKYEKSTRLLHGRFALGTTPCEA